MQQKELSFVAASCCSGFVNVVDACVSASITPFTCLSSRRAGFKKRVDLMCGGRGETSWDHESRWATAARGDPTGHDPSDETR